MPDNICAYGKTNLFSKRTSFTAAYDWEEVTKDAAKNGRAGLFHKLQKDLVNPRSEFNLGFISSPGGTKTLTEKKLLNLIWLFMKLMQKMMKKS